MILPLRVRHRRTITALALLLPLGVFAALGLRPVFPVSKTSASELVGSDAGRPSGQLVWRSIHVRDGTVWNVDLGSDWIEISTDAALPDLLAYLAPGVVAGEDLPDGALLLGSVAGSTPRRFPLPPGFEPAGYTLVLYSLGHASAVYTKEL